VRRLLHRLRHGSLQIELPDGERLLARGALPGPDATLRLHRWRPLWRLLTQGDLGLATSYRDGDWSTPDLVALLRVGAANDDAWQSTLRGHGPWRAAARAWHRLRANTRRGSRHNIAFHYDLGNDFYAQWLDAGMQYSSGLYATNPPVIHATNPPVIPALSRDPAQSLEEAQAAKLSVVLDLLDVQAGHKVLEIGCGWGGLAALIAHCRAHVTGLTLSQEQLAHAQQRAAAEGVADRVDLRLQDYRDVQGQYDRIVSIEMLEAVGEGYWPDYFRVLRERLAPGGHAVLQVITIGEEWFPTYRDGADFIQRFIFPGGMLPTRGALREQAERAGLELEECLLFGESYARTLAEWRGRFLANWPAIEALGFDANFRRLWEYYLCYCEAGFGSGRIDVGVYRVKTK